MKYLTISAALILFLFSCSQKSETTFIHIGDTHYNTDSEKFNEDQQFYRGVIELMNNIQELPYPEIMGGIVGEPLGVFVIGDLTEGKSSDIEIFSADWGLNGNDGLLKFPVYEGVGNHDGPPSTHPNGVVRRAIISRNSQRSNITSLSKNELHYSFDYNGVHFVQLNEYSGSENDVRYSGNLEFNRKGQAYGNPAEESLQFLESTLTNNVGSSNRPVILLQHYGIDGWPLNPWGDDYAWWTEEHALRLWETIKNYNVVAILVGHGHNHGIIDWNGIPVFQMDSRRGFGVYRIKDDKLVRVVRNIADDSWGEVSSEYLVNRIKSKDGKLLSGPLLDFENRYDQMTISWETMGSDSSVLKWGHRGFEFEEGVIDVLPIDNESNRFSVTLKNLKPNERYSYQIKTGDHYHVGLFYTAPLPEDNKVKLMISSFNAINNSANSSISTAIYDKLFEEPAYHSAVIDPDNSYFGYQPKNSNRFSNYLTTRMPILRAATADNNDLPTIYRYGPAELFYIDQKQLQAGGNEIITGLLLEIKNSNALCKVLVVTGNEISADNEKILTLFTESGMNLIIGKSSKGWNFNNINGLNFLSVETVDNSDYFGSLTILNNEVIVSIYDTNGTEVINQKIN